MQNHAKNNKKIYVPFRKFRYKEKVSSWELPDIFSAYHKKV